MSLFSYKAQKPTGELYEARRSAPDKFTLYRDVKAEGDTVVSASEVAGENTRRHFSIRGLFAGINARDKILLARNLSNMLQAGLALSRALSVIERQTKKRGLRDVIQKITAAIGTGRALSDALHDFPLIFSPLFVSMVKAGEESGSLPQALGTIASQLDSTYTLQRKIRGAMIYPIIIVVVIILISILMLVYVVPTVTATFKDLSLELPWNTKLVIFLSETFIHHTTLFLLSFVGVVALAAAFRKTPAFKNGLDWTLLHLPVIRTIVQESNSARTARTLSSLLYAGVEVVSAFEITADVVQNSRYRSLLARARERLKSGEPVSSTFAERTDLYPVFVSEMIAIGEETGKLSEMLKNVADFYESEVDQKTKDLSTIIEPVLMVVIGCAVAFFALSILTPIYSLVNAI